MTPEEIIKVLREVDADAKASEGDYYADQYAWHGAGEIADAVEQMASETARLRAAIYVVGACLADMKTRLEPYLPELRPVAESEGAATPASEAGTVRVRLWCAWDRGDDLSRRCEFSGDTIYLSKSPVTLDLTPAQVAEIERQVRGEVGRA